MDPNETLAALRRFVAAEILDDGDYRILDLVEALDGWLSKGGFLPQAWGTGHGWAGVKALMPIGAPVATRPEQVFEVRVHCDGASLVVGRYYDYAKALGHVEMLKGREKEMALLGASGADVVPVEVMP